MEAWIGVLGTVVGTALGALIALAGARRLARDERLAVRGTDNLRAFRVFVAEVALSVGALRQLPAVPKPWVTDRAVGLLEQVLHGGKAGAQMAAKSKVYRRYGTRYDDLSARLGAAFIDLKMRDLPPNVEVAVARAMAYLEKLAARRTPELDAEWAEVHDDLIAAGNELGALAAGSSSHGGSHMVPTDDVNQRGSEPGTDASNHRTQGPRSASSHRWRPKPN